MAAGVATAGQPLPTPPNTHPTPPGTTNWLNEIPLVVRRHGSREQPFYSLSPTQVPQHVVGARTPHDLARALMSCFGEVECASYARRRGMMPDTAHLSPTDSFDDPVVLGGKPVDALSVAAIGDGRSRNRPSGLDRQRQPADYTPNTDGTWLSPAGRLVRHPDACRSIVRRRHEAGLPVVPDGGSFDLGTIADQIGAAAVGAGLTPHEWLTQAIRDAVTPPPPPAKLSTVRAKKNQCRGQLELPLNLAEQTKPKRRSRRAA